MKNYLHLQHACATLTLPVFITSNHSCAECLDSGTACNHICCYNWYLNTGIKSGFLEQIEDGLKLKMKAPFRTEHTKTCTKSLSDFCSVSEALSKASMKKKRPRKNKGESKQVAKKRKLATLTRLPKVKQNPKKKLSKQSQLMYKSQVASMQKTLHAGKDCLKNCLSTIELMIAGHLQCWNDVSNEEKENLHKNAKYIHDIIGNHASQSIQKQVSSVSSQPWMQYQGCSAYCGLCALNNAYREDRFTVEMLDNIADDLWLRQIEQLGMSLTSEFQSLRDISGHYSIEVLRESASRMSDDPVEVDGTVQHIMSQNINADSFINELALVYKFPCSFILAWRAQNHYTCPYSHINSVAFQFIEKTTTSANITSTDEDSSGG